MGSSALKAIRGTRFKDLSGTKFNRLTVLHEVDSLGSHTRWMCLCDCGTTLEVLATHLRSGRTKSCGCYGKELASAIHTTHGQSKTKTYRAWGSMKERCYSEKHLSYPNYGGRGIQVCDRWLHSYPNFLEDMGERPDGLTLERKDNEGDYTPENCRWATWTDQMLNRRPWKRISSQLEKSA